MSFLSPTAQIRFVIAGLSIAALFGFLWYVRHQGVVAERERQRAAEMQAYVEAAAKANAVARKLETELAALDVANKQLAKDLERETNRDPIYRTCVVPKQGVGLLQQAIAKGN